ncbi:hypothetical protein BDZ45DRAFT_797258 [Acephala macrosclerotiorum]|nr:hypothetical protein BDZ45DRAFT_797258 [Acephala macrosclerotiorum]
MLFQGDFRNHSQLSPITGFKVEEFATFVSQTFNLRFLYLNLTQPLFSSATTVNSPSSRARSTVRSLKSKLRSSFPLSLASKSPTVHSRLAPQQSTLSSSRAEQPPALAKLSGLIFIPSSSTPSTPTFIHNLFAFHNHTPSTRTLPTYLKSGPAPVAESTQEQEVYHSIMAIEEISRLEKELLVVKAQLSEAEKAIKKREDERDDYNEKYEEAENEAADAKKNWQKALQKVKRLQKNLEIAQELVKTTDAKLVETEKKVERIRSEGEDILEEAEIERRHDELGVRLGKIEEELEKLKEQDLADWASWPADELVRRWENGDFDYLVFDDRKNGNIKKLRAAYLKCKPQGAASEGILFAISTEIIQDKDCDTPWESSDWDPAYAAFPKPEEAADEEVMDEEKRNDSIGVEQSADATTSFTTARISMASENADCSSVLGKRTRESTTESCTTTSTLFSLTNSSYCRSEGVFGDETDIKPEVKEETKTDIDIIMKTEVDELDDAATKAKAEFNEQHTPIIKTEGDIITKIEVEEQDGPLINGETEEEKRIKQVHCTEESIESETYTKVKIEKVSSSTSMLAFPGSYPTSEQDSEERPAKRERLENSEDAGTFNSNVLGSYFSFDGLESSTQELVQQVESNMSEPGRELRSPTPKPTPEDIERLDSQFPEPNLDLDLEYAAAEQYLEFDD